MGARAALLRGALLLALLAALQPASSSRATDLTDVRIGLHPRYTRVVLETDGRAGYRIERDAPDQLTIHLEADADERALASASGQLRSLRVTPRGRDASEVALALRGEVAFSELVLENPPRIVIDLRTGRAPTATVAAPPATAPQEREPTEETPAPAATPEPEKPEESEASGPVSDAGARYMNRTTNLREVLEEGGAPAEDGAATSEPSPEDEAPADVTAAAISEDEERASPQAAPQIAGETGLAPLEAPARPERKGFTGFLPAAIDHPLALGGIGVALLLLLIALVLRGQRRSDEASSASPFATDEPFSLDDAEVMGGDATAEADREQSEATARGAPFAAPEEEAPVEVESAELSDQPTLPPAELVAAEGRPSGGTDLEARLAALESRIEELAEGKERLERQVAAQSEELRVQRAAIARTQRVLRTVVRPEDEATEPVPKG